MPYYKKKYKKSTYKRKPVYKRKTKGGYRKKRYPRYKKVPETGKMYLQIKNTDLDRDWLPALSVPGLVLKDTKITNEFNTSTGFGSLSAIFSQHPTLQKVGAEFRWARCSKIRVRLIPQEVMATNYAGATGSGGLFDNGETPRITWINDDGSTEEGVVPSPPGQIDFNDAESFGKRYKSMNFDKPLNITISPVYRTGLSTIGQKPTTTSNRWVPTGGGANFVTQLLPNNNLMFGFPEFPSGFSYRTEITLDMVFKDHYVDNT